MEIIVYSMNGCANCVAASNLLKSKGISHKVVKVDEDEEAYDIFKALNVRSVPQIALKHGDVIAHLWDYKGLLKLTDEDFNNLK